jgi:hypothetical protein
MSSRVEKLRAQLAAAEARQHVVPVDRMVSVRVTKAELQRLDAAAAFFQLSRSEYLRRLLNDHVWSVQKVSIEVVS